jgi:hypothetical protein
MCCKLTLFLPLFLLLLLLAPQTSFSAEKIFLIYNAKSNEDVTFADAEHLTSKLDSVADTLQSFDSNIKIIRLPLTSLSHLGEEIKQHSDGSRDVIRGLVFEGHGNESVYAFSGKEIYSGRGQIKTILQKTFQSNNLAPNLLLYFSGCAMGSGKNSFQENLVESLIEIKWAAENSESEKSLANVKLDVIAHENSVNLKGGQWNRPTIIDRISIDSKIGLVLHRYQSLPNRLVGAYGPTFSNLFTVIAVGLLAKYFNANDLAPLGLFLVPIINGLADSVGKVGYSMNINEKVKGYAHDLLKRSLTKSSNMSGEQCRNLFGMQLVQN